MSKVKLRMGDRVKIPNDDREYEVMGVDSAQSDGFALLRLRGSRDKSFWQAIANCEVVRCSQ
jgi:hypothetical protein